MPKLSSAPGVPVPACAPLAALCPAAAPWGHGVGFGGSFQELSLAGQQLPGPESARRKHLDMCGWMRGGGRGWGRGWARLRLLSMRQLCSVLLLAWINKSHSAGSACCWEHDARALSGCARAAPGVQECGSTWGALPGV